MMKTICFLFMLSALLSCCSAFGAEERQADTDQAADEIASFDFDGVWKPRGAMLRGVLVPPPTLPSITLRIEKDRYEVTVQGEDHSDRGIFLLDETVTPKRMVIKSEEGPNRGQIILAIYEIKGAHAMRVCYDLSGRAFPTEFKAPKNTDLYVVGYRRQENPEATDDPNSSK